MEFTRDVEFTIDVKEFLKFIKLFKIDSSLYLCVTKQKIFVKNIDFKQCLGVLTGSFSQTNPQLQNPIYFKVDYNELIGKLQAFKQKASFSINRIHSSLRIWDPSDKLFEYYIRCDLGSKIEKYCDLTLLDDFQTHKLKFQIDSTVCLKLLKIIIAVENVILFRFYKDNPDHLLHLVSKKISSFVSELVPIETLKNYTYLVDQPILEFEIYYNAIFTNLIKQKPELIFSLFEDYLVIENSLENEGSFDFKIYIPVRKVQ